MNDKELVSLLLNQYIVDTEDGYTKRFFNIKSEENLTYKQTVLLWAIRNKKIITQYENLDHNMFFEDYPPEGEMWDIF